MGEDKEKRGSALARALGWASVAVGMVALGIIVGQQLRERYRFNRRTPYDYYAHAGDSSNSVEYGLGI